MLITLFIIASVLTTCFLNRQKLIYGFLIVNLENGLHDEIFDTLGDRTEDLEESGPEMETPGRDLDDGGDVVRKGREKKQYKMSDSLKK